MLPPVLQAAVSAEGTSAAPAAEVAAPSAEALLMAKNILGQGLAAGSQHARGGALPTKPPTHPTAASGGVPLGSSVATGSVAVAKGGSAGLGSAKTKPEKKPVPVPASPAGAVSVPPAAMLGGPSAELPGARDDEMPPARAFIDIKDLRSECKRWVLELITRDRAACGLETSRLVRPCGCHPLCLQQYL